MLLAISVLFYPVLMAVAFLSAGTTYGGDGFAKAMVFPMAWIAAYAFVIGRGKGLWRVPPWRAWLWVLPWLVLDAYIVIAHGTHTHGDLLWVGLLVPLVAFAEETVFRGVLLRGLLAKGVVPAMFVSAAAFSALHIVNIIAGQPSDTLITQLVLTFIFGLAFAPLALLCRSLWPLMLVHMLWDYIALSGMLDDAPAMIWIDLALQVIVGAVAWIAVLKRENTVRQMA